MLSRIIIIVAGISSSLFLRVQSKKGLLIKYTNEKNPAPIIMRQIFFFIPTSFEFKVHSFYTIHMLAKIVKHTAIQASGRLVGLFIGLVTIAFLTRYLGQEGFGWYMVAFSWLQIFSIVVDFGLFMVGLKFIGKRPEEKQNIFSQLFWLRFFSAVIFVLLLPQIVWLFPYDLPIKLAVGILSWSFFFASLNQLLTVSFQSRIKMQFVAAGEILGKLGALLALLLVVHFDLGFYWAIFSVIVYAFLMFLFLLFRLDNSFKLLWYWRWDLVKKILIEAWPLGAIIILNTIYFKADIIILSWFFEAAVVGLYGAAYKILEILVSFPAMYLGLLLPYFSKWWRSNNKNELKKYITYSFDLAWILAVPLIVLGLFVSRSVMSFVAGPEFAAAGLWLKLLLLAAAFIFFGQLFGYVLVAIGEQRLQLKIFLIIAGVTVISYFIFIPKYGAWAAALLTIAAEFLAALFLGLQVRKKIGWEIKQSKFWRILGLGFIMFSVVWALRNQPWWLYSLIGLLVYVYMLWLFDFWNFKDFKKIIRN